MGSNSFQIPGLSTLQQPLQPQAPQAENVNDMSLSSVTAGAEKAVDTSNTSSHALGSSGNSETKTSTGNQQGDMSSTTAVAMDLDQPESAKQADASTTSATVMELDQTDMSNQIDTSAVKAVEEPPSPPSLTQGLEALLGGLDPLPNEMASTTADRQLSHGEQNIEMVDGDNQEERREAAEFEEDSSPYESSSDSSSSDDSDDDADSDDGKELLNPEEMARILMEAGSDDEADGKTKGTASASQLRTKNELPEEPIPKPDVTITAETKMEELGEIEHIVENSIVIKANTSGEYRVLDSGSVLCNEERVVIAALADLIGSVREPRYTARFTNEDEMKALNLSLGSKIYYAPEHAYFVFTEPLQALKGTDASNLHDEEVVDEEVEFSDDEKEAAYKREQKEKKRARRGGITGRGGRFGSYETSSVASSETIKLQYDDDDEDGPYRPLSRPSNFGLQSPIGTEPIQSTPNSQNSGSYRGGRGEFRGRGRGRSYDRGGRGNRGSNRGSNRGGPGYSQPPRPQAYPPQPSQQQPYNNMNPVPPPQFNSQAFPPPPPPQFYGASAGQQPQAPNPQYPFPSWPQNMPFVPPPPPQFQQQSQGGQAPHILTPALYAALQSQFQGQNNGGQQPGQWPPHGGSG